MHCLPIAHVYLIYGRLRKDSPYSKMYDTTFQAKVKAENAALQADSVAAATKAQAETDLVNEVSRLELAAGEHAEPPMPKVAKPSVKRAVSIKRGKDKAAAKEALLSSASSTFALTTAIAMTAHAAGLEVESGVFGDESLTGKRKRGGGKVAKARAQKPAPAPAGGGVSAAQLDDSEDVTDAENSSDSDNEAAGGGARVAPVRGQPREINSEILPEESGLNMLWQDYGDAVTGGKKTVTAKKKIFFDTLDSIIVQYEEIDGGESRAAAFMAVKVELDGVVVPAAVNVDHVIRKHCGDVQ